MVRTTVGAVGSVMSRTIVRVPWPRRPSVTPKSRPTTTTRSPTSSSSGESNPVRAIDPIRDGSAPVTSYTSRVAPSLTRTSSRPSVFTTSGSSTPVSCTLVPVPLAGAGAGAGAPAAEPAGMDSAAPSRV